MVIGMTFADKDYFNSKLGETVFVLVNTVLQKSTCALLRTMIVPSCSGTMSSTSCLS